MITRRHLTRTVVGLLSAVAGLGACALVATLALDWAAGPAQHQLVLLAWVCGLVSAVLAVAAAQEHSDPDDDPRYLHTVVHGLVDEWRR